MKYWTLGVALALVMGLVAYAGDRPRVTNVQGGSTSISGQGGVTSPLNIAVLDAGVALINGQLQVLGPIVGGAQIGTTAGLDAGYAMINGQLDVEGNIIGKSRIVLSTGNQLYLDGVAGQTYGLYYGNDATIVMIGGIRPPNNGQFHLGSATEKWGTLYLADNVNRTITDQSADCDGAATGNAGAGKICIKAGDGSMVFTNSYVTSSTLVHLTNITDDATCLSGYATVGSSTVTIGCVGAGVATGNTVMAFQLTQF